MIGEFQRLGDELGDRLTVEAVNTDKILVLRYKRRFGSWSVTKEVAFEDDAREL